MEHWGWRPEVLSRFARHHETGEPIPAELVDQLVAARDLNVGVLTLRQVQFGVLDMGFHGPRARGRRRPTAVATSTRSSGGPSGRPVRPRRRDVLAGQLRPPPRRLRRRLLRLPVVEGVRRRHVQPLRRRGRHRPGGRAGVPRGDPRAGRVACRRPRCSRTSSAARRATRRSSPSWGSRDWTPTPSVARRAIALLDLTDLGADTTADAGRRAVRPGRRGRRRRGVRVAAVRRPVRRGGSPAPACGWPRSSTSRPATEPADARRRGDRRGASPPAPTRSTSCCRTGRGSPATTSAAADVLDAVRAETGGRRDEGDHRDRRAARPRRRSTGPTHFAIAHGADFVKTSTGKTPVSATPEAAEIVLEAIDVSGRPVGFKASGGIRTARRRRRLPRPRRLDHGPGLGDAGDVPLRRQRPPRRPARPPDRRPRPTSLERAEPGTIARWSDLGWRGRSGAAGRGLAGPRPRRARPPRSRRR